MAERVSTEKKTDAKPEQAGSRSRQENLSGAENSPLEHILGLHQSWGNQAVQRLFRSGIIQAKLKIGEPNDTYEKEADRVAEQVIRMPKTSAVSGQRSAFSQKNESIQMKPG